MCPQKITLPLKRWPDGWWITRLKPSQGPYETKKEAEDARRSVLKFYRANPSYPKILRSREMSSLKVRHSDVVKVFEEFGSLEASKWSVSRLHAKLAKLPGYVTDQEPIADKAAKKTLDALLQAMKDKQEILILPDDAEEESTKEEKKAERKKAKDKPAKGKKAAKVEEVEEEESDEEDADEPEADEEEEEPAPPKKGKKVAKVESADEASAKVLAKRRAKAKASGAKKKADADEKPAKGKKGKPAKKAEAPKERQKGPNRELFVAAYKIFRKMKDQSYSSENLDALEKVTKGKITRSTLNFWMWNWRNDRRIPSPAELK